MLVQEITIEDLASQFLDSPFWNLYLDSNTTLKKSVDQFLKSKNLTLTTDANFIKSFRYAIAKNLESSFLERV